MDLNEKLAARRRELAVEAENAIKAENDAKTAHQQILAAEANKIKIAERELIDAEVARHLAKQGLGNIKPSEVAKRLAVTKSVDVEADMAITESAASRITNGEKTVMTAFVVLGLLCFFLAWWLGSIIIGVGMLYRHLVISDHKNQIIYEGKLNLARMPKESVKDVENQVTETPTISTGVDL